MCGTWFATAGSDFSLPIVNYVVFVGVVIALAYLTTLAVAKLYNRGSRAKNIRIIERVNLAADKSLWLIELAGKYYFLYTDKAGVNQLDQLTADQLDISGMAADEGTSFVDLLRRKMKGQGNDNDNT